jgi:hypothetical protein
LVAPLICVGAGAATASAGVSHLSAANVGVALRASTAPRPKPVPHFKNCAAVNKKYPGGIARPGARDKRPHGGHAAHKPYVNAAYYRVNAAMDRDHDGIACEN